MTRPNAAITTVPSQPTLAAMLKEAKLSQAKAARALGVSRRTIERYLSPTASERMPFPLFFTFFALCYGYLLPTPKHGKRRNQEPT